MEKVCKKCGNNLYSNKVKCPFCGHPIKGASTSYQGPANTYSYQSKPKNKTKPLTGGEILVLLAISFFVPPLGIIFFFGFNKRQPGIAIISLVLGIFGFAMYTG